VNEIWRRIEAWFTKNVPGDFYAQGFGPVPLPEGASEEEIRKAEKKLKVRKGLRLRLPDDVRQSYLLHDGCDGIFENYELLPVEKIPYRWRVYIDGAADARKTYGESAVTLATAGPMKNELWNPYWIPLLDTGGGRTYFCVDLDPAEGGQVGQLIRINTDDQVGKVVAGSFTEWLSAFADELDAGLFSWEEDYEAIVRKKPGN
jgi:cell wall assembly regulator SMI1